MFNVEPRINLSKISRLLEKRSLENTFFDFLMALLPLEHSGLKLDQLFVEAVKGNINLPKPYVDLAKRFYLIYTVTSDPHMSLKILASTVPWERLKVFFNGYVEVSLSVGDTLSYVDSFIKEELSGVRARIDDAFNLVDNLFEAYLIVALGIIVYFSLPVLPAPMFIFLTLISAISTFTFLLLVKILSLASIGMDEVSFYVTLTLVTVTPYVAYLLRGLFFIQTVVIALAGSSTYLTKRRYLKFDLEFNNFVENVYAESKEGYPVDQAIIKASSIHGDPIKWVGALLNLGLNPTIISSTLKLPRFHRRIFDSIVTPIGYCKVPSSYLNYVLSVVENVRSLRRRLEERSRVYYVYVALMLVALVTVIKVFSTIPSFSLDTSSSLIHVVYSTVVASLILASCLRNGFWYSSLHFYIYVAVVTFVLKII